MGEKSWIVSRNTLTKGVAVNFLAYTKKEATEIITRVLMSRTQ